MRSFGDALSVGFALVAAEELRLLLHVLALFVLRDEVLRSRLDALDLYLEGEVLACERVVQVELGVAALDLDDGAERRFALVVGHPQTRTNLDIALGNLVRWDDGDVIIEVLAVRIVLTDGKGFLLALEAFHGEDFLLEAVDRHVHARLENHGVLLGCIAENGTIFQFARVHERYGRSKIHVHLPFPAPGQGAAARLSVSILV